MASATVEDYVKAIYALERESPTGEATVARLAASLGVTKGTVTSMVAKLREAKLAKAERYGGIRLTAKGSRLALDVIRRHRLLEVFLVETLGFDWSEVHDEAERLEHAMSAKLLDRLDAFLGRPLVDPHGDPIPDAAGKVADSIGEPLSSMPAGARATVLRVSDLDAAFLAFAARHGLKPGAGVTVIDLSPEAQSISVRAAGRTAVSMSLAAAARVTVGRG
jgi:DtxR family Mn-dependent transcriptional regulator